MSNRAKTIFIVILLCVLGWSVFRLADASRGAAQTQAVSSAEDDRVRVALSLGGDLTPWETDLIDDLSQSCAAQNFELVYNDPAEDTASWQLEDIRSLLEQDVRYLILCPSDNSMLGEVKTLADSKGVSIILVASDLKLAGECTSMIYINGYAEGELCAKALLNTYGTTRDCHIIEIYGPEGSPIAASRDQGFRAAISDYPNLHIMKTCYGGFSQLTAKNAIEELISANPKGTFNAVFACGDEDGLGALQAFKIAGYNPGTDVSIVSISGIQDTKKAIIAGEYTATVESSRHLGSVAIAIITRLEAGEDVSKLFAMPFRLCTADNLSAYEPTLY